jgi:hypothetical protein
MFYTEKWSIIIDLFVYQSYLKYIFENWFIDTFFIYFLAKQLINDLFDVLIYGLDEFLMNEWLINN